VAGLDEAQALLKEAVVHPLWMPNIFTGAWVLGLKIIAMFINLYMFTFFPNNYEHSFQLEMSVHSFWKQIGTLQNR